MNPKLWDKRYQELLEYKKEQGDTNVPRRYEVNPQLGVWVSNQRQYYKKYKTGISGWGMTESRISRLEEIGFEWVLTGGRNGNCNNNSGGSGSDSGSDSVRSLNNTDSNRNHSNKYFTSTSEWDTMYDELVAYKRLHGDTYVPKFYEKNQRLSNWVQIQIHGLKRYSKGVKCKEMTLDRFQLLLEIGFALEAVDDSCTVISANNPKEEQKHDLFGKEDDDNIDEDNEDNSISKIIDETEKAQMIEIFKNVSTGKKKRNDEGDEEAYEFNKKKRKITLKDHSGNRQQQRQKKERYSSTKKSISSSIMKLNAISGEDHHQFNSQMKWNSSYNSSQQEQHDYAKDDNFIYFEAIAECGSGATLDSIAEIVLQKFTKKVSVDK